MAVYRYKHEWCGMEQDIFLNGEERNTVTVPCYRCGLNVTARQIRDKSIKVGQADGTTGLLRRDGKQKYHGRGHNQN